MSLKNRTLTLPIIAVLCAILLQSGFRADASGTQGPQAQQAEAPLIVLEPPGEDANTPPITVLLEVGSSADRESVSQAALALGAHVLYPTRLAYTGIVVSVERRLLPQLSAIPGVLQTHMMQAKQRLRTRISDAALTDTISRPSGLTGRGVRIGIIDSGIDYTHLTFGGAGAAAFANNNPTIIEPGSFPTAKVVGGYDFVGDNYDANNELGSSIAAPDPDPLDCAVLTPTVTLSRGGHGTHVASNAAGFGVQNGQAYPGPYDDSLQNTQFDVAPGMAPNATLYAYKIFGCRGSSTYLLKALEHAIDPNGDGDPSDHEVDVLILALGAPFGSPYEPEAIAIQKAIKAGIVVVAAAGDIGSVFYASSTPGSADAALTVGSSKGLTIADFSSRGPQRGNQNVKPDLVAPGVGVVGAASGGGTTSVAMDGSSFSAALAGGAAALLREEHPDWKPAFIKSALIGTATPLVNETEVLYPVTLAGAGRIDPANAAKSTLLVTLKSQSGGLSFGAPRAYKNRTITHHITLNNLSDQAQQVTLSSTAGVTETGVFMDFGSDQVAIPARQSVTVPVTVTVQPAELESTADPFTAPFQGIFARFSLYEHSGLINISPIGGQTIRVPFQLFPVSASQASAANFYNAVSRGQNSYALELKNTGARNQTSSAYGAQTPIVSAFELVAKSPILGDELFLTSSVARISANEQGCDDQERNDQHGNKCGDDDNEHNATKCSDETYSVNAKKCDDQESTTKLPSLSDLVGGADLEYVGITNTYSVTQNIDNTTLFFGTASYKPWSTPNEVQMRVYLDTTGPQGVPDGTDDYVLVSTSFGAVTKKQANDSFISLLYRIQADGSLVWAQNFPTYLNGFSTAQFSPFVDTTPFNSRVMFQQIDANYIGLSATHTAFRYHIETRARDIGNFAQVVDRVPETGSLDYDILKSAIAPINAALGGTPNLYQRPVFADVDGGFVNLAVSQTVLEQRQEQFILLLHHNNPVATQAEILSIHKPDPLYIP